MLISGVVSERRLGEIGLRELNINCQRERSSRRYWTPRSGVQLFDCYYYRISLDGAVSGSSLPI
jgi:hypothetical protein